MNSPVQIDNTAHQRKGFAGRLITEGVLTVKQAQEAESAARAMQVPLTRYLVDAPHVDNRQLAELASAEFGVPLFDLDAMNLECCQSNEVRSTGSLWSNTMPFPLSPGPTSFCCVSDPLNLSALENSICDRHQY